jgi:hypothetical protein
VAPTASGDGLTSSANVITWKVIIKHWLGVKAIKLVLGDLGMDPRRFAIEWVSSAEALRFAEVVTAFTEKIKALGPNPLEEKGQGGDRLNQVGEIHQGIWSKLLKNG